MQSHAPCSLTHDSALCCPTGGVLGLALTSLATDAWGWIATLAGVGISGASVSLLGLCVASSARADMALTDTRGKKGGGEAVGGSRPEDKVRGCLLYTSDAADE